MKRKILYCVMVLAGALCACSGINKVSEAKDRQMIYGDVNEDGTVNAADALAVLRHAAKLENL